MQWGRRVLSVWLAILPAVNTLDAREGFGFNKHTVVITRTKPPLVHFAGTRVSVRGDEQLASVVTGVLNPTFTIATPSDVDINLIVDKLDVHDGWETKTDYEYRQTGSRDEWNAAKGRYEKKGVYASVPVVRHILMASGSLTGHYELRDASGKVVDAGLLNVAFHERYPDGEGAPEPSAVREVLLHDAARTVGARILPTTDIVSVPLPKGIFEEFIPLAESGRWEDYLRAVESVPERGVEQETYRQYAMAVAKEAMAYATPDRDGASHLLAEAVEHCRKAAIDFINAPPPLDRIEASAKAYAAWTIR